MPRRGAALVTVPGDEIVTCYGLKALSMVRTIAPPTWIVEMLTGPRASREGVLSALRRLDPALFIGMGHGKEDVFTGYGMKPIFRVCDTDALAGRIVYLFSCLTAKELGKDIVAKGAAAFIGYDREYAFMAAEPLRCRDPFTEDPYAAPFFIPPMEIIRALLSGYTAGEAHARGVDAFNDMIEEWSRSSDPAAPYIVFFLKMDRDAQRLYGDPSASAAPAAPRIPIAPIVAAVITYALTGSPAAAVSAALATLPASPR